MKKLVFLATTLLMFLAITVNAQQRGPRERMTVSYTHLTLPTKA